jgi:hypothetical protein
MHAADTTWNIIYLAGCHKPGLTAGQLKEEGPLPNYFVGKHSRNTF